MEFFGNGSVSIEGINMSVCLRDGTILNREGKWYDEDDCMQTRSGRITLASDNLDFGIATAVKARLKGSATFEVIYSGNWNLKKNS